MRLSRFVLFSLIVTVASAVTAQENSAPATRLPSVPVDPAALPPLPAIGHSGPVDRVGAAMDVISPLSPEEIKTLRKRIDETKRATATAVHQPRPVYTSQVVDLSPGATPPSIRVSNVHGAVVNFVDAVGTPWPIRRVENFADTDFTGLYEAGSPTLTVKALSEYANSNMVVFLQGLLRPVNIFVASGQKEVDFNVDLMLPRLAPGSAPPGGGGVSTDADSFDPMLTSLLAGVAPEGVSPLTVKGAGGVKAWRLASGRVVIRTTLMMLSPSWKRSHRAGDGTAVYEIAPTPVVLLATAEGKTEKIMLEGF